MGFQAQDAVVALDWDLRPFVDAHGTVPEPSQARLDTYEKTMLSIFEVMGLNLSATASEEEVDSALREKLTAGKTLNEAGPEIQKMHEQIRKVRIKAAAGVCGGHPNVDEITRLPPRVREALLGWIASWASDPTLPQDDTSPSLVTSRNGTSAT